MKPKNDAPPKPPSRAALRRAEVEAAKECLRAILRPGDTLWIVRRRFQRAQHPETFDVVRIADNFPTRLTHDVATALDAACYTDGLKSLDRYAFCSALWPDGFDCAGKCCPSNEHTGGDRTSRHHASGAYALRFEAL